LARNGDRPRAQHSDLTQRLTARHARHLVPLLATLIVASGLLAPVVAQAQTDTFYADRIFIAGAPDDGVAIWRPHMGERTRFFGQAALGFALNPVRLENTIADANERQVASAAGFSAPLGPQLVLYTDIGVEIMERFAFQLEFPLTLFQSGNGGETAGPGRNDLAQVNVRPVAANDMRLDARAIIFRTNTRSFKLGAQAGVWFPTGNHGSYGGDGAVCVSLGVAAEFDFKLFFLVANTGPQFRNSNAIDSFHVGHEWRYGLGGFVPLRGNSIRLGLQVFGSAPLTGDTTFKQNSPLEWLAEGRYHFDKEKQAFVGLAGGTRFFPAYSPDFRVIASVGYWFGISDSNPRAPGKRFKNYADHGGDRDKDGIPDDIDLCPDEPEDKKPPNPDDGCPALPDRDGDGIPDITDKCPDQPEDFDHIEDADGCPEDDADKDGIPDAQDACPKEPGEKDPDPAKNGCPKFIRRISGSSEIQILKPVQFATGRATILPNSYPILDEVVRLLKVNPEITHLDIEGHTDNRGSDELNEKLSNDRANSVMKYLVDHGIEQKRLAAQGFGPKRPIADNNTTEGRAKNRRTEFHIRSQTGGGARPPAKKP
jgi:OmpA-OmpF porin, OOP family